MAVEDIAEDGLHILSVTPINVTSSTQETYTVLEALKSVGGAKVLGGKIDLKGGSDKAWCSFTFGDSIQVPSTEAGGMLERLKELSGITDATLKWNGLRFDTGRDFLNFAKQAGLDWDRLDWDHDSVTE